MSRDLQQERAEKMRERINTFETVLNIDQFLVSVTMWCMEVLLKVHTVFFLIVVYFSMEAQKGIAGISFLTSEVF